MQPLSDETMHVPSFNTENYSRLDIAAYGFWGSRSAFFDARIFSIKRTNLTLIAQEQEKKGNTTKESDK